MADERGARAADSPGVPALPGPLVDAGWLRRHSADVAAGRLVLVDVRWYLDGRSGHDAFLTGHLPGARWVDLDAELSSPATPTNGRHPLPSPAVFAAAMRRLGVDDTTLVVAYDDASGSVAARLWWLLRVHDHPVAVLDGGLGAWPPEGLEHGAALPVAHLGTFRERPWPERRFVDADRVDDLRKDPAALVLDARATARYEQGDLAVDPRRGHVPGARSAPWVANTTDGPGSALRPPAELHDRFVGLGAGEARSVVCYCGSGRDGVPRPARPRARRLRRPNRPVPRLVVAVGRRHHPPRRDRTRPGPPRPIDRSTRHRRLVAGSAVAQAG